MTPFALHSSAKLYIASATKYVRSASRAASPAADWAASMDESAPPATVRDTVSATRNAKAAGRYQIGFRIRRASNARVHQARRESARTSFSTQGNAPWRTTWEQAPATTTL